MTLTTAIVVLLIAFLLILIEIFLIPGTGFVGIIGIVLLMVGVWAAARIETTQAYITLSLAGIGAIGVTVLSFRANTWKRFALKSEVKGKAASWKSDLKVGQVGKTISRISPMGKARFDHELVEVTSQGEFIEEQREIKIIQILGKKIIVEPINEPS